MTLSPLDSVADRQITTIEAIENDPVGKAVVAKWIGLDNPRSALIFGGLMGTTSGVAGGLAATDEKLVPYGAMTATFYTGLGCLLGPSVVFMVFRAVFGT